MGAVHGVPVETRLVRDEGDAGTAARASAAPRRTLSAARARSAFSTAREGACTRAFAAPWASRPVTSVAAAAAAPPTVVARSTVLAPIVVARPRTSPPSPRRSPRRRRRAARRRDDGAARARLRLRRRRAAAGRLRARRRLPPGEEELGLRDLRASTKWRRRAMWRIKCAGRGDDDGAPPAAARPCARGSSTTPAAPRASPCAPPPSRCRRPAAHRRRAPHPGLEEAARELQHGTSTTPYEGVEVWLQRRRARGGRRWGQADWAAAMRTWR